MLYKSIYNDCILWLCLGSFTCQWMCHSGKMYKRNGFVRFFKHI